ncbi:MAG: hypothetical protein QM727_01185 [Niabella sp.]
MTKALLNEIATGVLSRPWEACSIETLQQEVEKCPASAPLQLLLSQKVKEEGKEELYASQWEKTLLFFNNPLLLEHLFNRAPQKTEEVATVAEKAKEEKIQDEGMEVPLPLLKIEPLAEDALLSFTPYHTIDYFASQGIRLGEELKANDQFGRQLKSFTNWLKEMRRLPESKVTANLTPFEASKIEKMAEKSISGDNALTEAMAQVWAKQGLIEKAVDIYKKLSLQNPAKSAYFAAKIEHLKKTL